MFVYYVEKKSGNNTFLTSSAASDYKCPDGYYTLQPKDVWPEDGKILYNTFAPILPCILDSKWADNLDVYIPYSNIPGCFAGCYNPDNTNNYFTWVSSVLNQPIMAGYIVNCKSGGCDISGSRAKCNFSTCCIDGITHADFSHTNWDRGHMVPSSSLELMHVNGGRGTFNMCNISPQTIKLNQKDWFMLERLLDSQMNGKSWLVLQGPLFNSANTCIIPDKLSPIASAPCTGHKSEIRIPYAFWKMVIEIESFDSPHLVNKTWTWIYDKAQTTGNPDTPPYNEYDKAIQNTDQALDASGIERIEREMGFLFPQILKDVAQSSCNKDLHCANTWLGFINGMHIGLSADNKLVNMKDSSILHDSPDPSLIAFFETIRTVEN